MLELTPTFLPTFLELTPTFIRTDPDILNAVNETKHAGPLSQFGGALFGERGAQIGGSIDKAISLRSILKSGKGFIDGIVGGDVKPGDAQGVISSLKKYYDLHEENGCQNPN